jgi:hypothetical protein
MFWEGESSDQTCYFTALQMKLCNGLMRALATAGSHAEEKKDAGVVSIEDEVALMLGAAV